MATTDFPIVSAQDIQLLALTVADNIAAKYPKLPHLNPKQVADVLWDRTDRSAMNSVRDRLMAGTLIPGLPKQGGRWLVPTEDLIRIFDNMVGEIGKRSGARPTGSKLPNPSRGTGKRRFRAPIGPRVGIYGFGEVFAEWDRLLDQELVDWSSRLNIMALSQEEGWYRGYDGAVEALIRAGIEKGTHRRRDLLIASDYSGVRRTLDKAPDTLFVSRSTAAFYLGMSPKTFQTKLKKGPHPFIEPRGGASIGAVRVWFEKLVHDKHAQAVPDPKTIRQGRATLNDRPYLIDASGMILADAEVCGIPVADIADALARGGSVVVLTLADAVEQPWRKDTVRGPWAAGYLRLLRQQLRQAEQRIAEIDNAAHENKTGPATGPSRKGERI
jgi:hypothetical protein